MIRLTTPNDLHWLPEIERSASTAFASLDLSLGPLETAPADAWRAPCLAGTVWVAEDAGRPVGFLAAERVPGGLHVLELDVAREHQGRGLGRWLLGHVQAWARAEGATFVSLTTFREVPWNAPFYRSMGFVEASGAALTPRLAALVAAETAKGLPDRCAMVWASGSDPEA